MTAVLKLLAAAGDQHSTIADIRLATPLQALATAGGCELRLRSFHDCSRAELAWADVLVLQRPTSSRPWKLLQHMQASGGQVVVEIDDLLTQMDAGLDHAGAVRRGLPWLLRCLAAADVVTVSTARLGAALATQVKRWQVLPNSALTVFDDLPPPQPLAPVSLLFAASDQLRGGPALAALPAVLAQGGVQIVAIGRAAQALAAAGIAATAMPALPRRDFVALLRALPNAVAVVPLDDTPFNACKSAIKFFDCGAAGLAVLCSDVSPYREVIENGRSGALVANTEAAWTGALLQAVGNPSWRLAVGAAAQQQVRQQHTLAHSVAAWSTLLQSLPARSGPARPMGPWWGQPTERIQAALRAANRRRLARRAQRTTQPGKPS